jgi:phage shock protein E
MKTYILDVRSPDEYESGHRENAINLPVDELFNNSENAFSILKNIEKDDIVHVYCFSGSRASMAKKLLESMGYTQVINLGGLE